MPHKNCLRLFNNIVNGSMTTSITSPATSIQFLDDIGAQFNWTGAPVGTFSVQISADYAQDSEGNIQNPGNWISIIFTYWNGTIFVTSNSIPTTVGSPIYLDLALLSAPWIRFVYTSVSGSGTLNSFITAKSVSS